MHTIKEVAELLKLAESTIYELIAKGKLVACHFGPHGGAKRIRDDDLQAYIESCRTVPSGTKPRPKRTRLKHLNR